MTLRKGLPAKNAATDADDTRYDFGGLVVQNLDGSPRGGLLGSVRSIVSARANMAVDVAAFTAAAVRDGGVVLLANDGTVSVSITAAPASNSRYTVVYAKQNDSSSTVTTPDANDTPVIGTVDGTAAASPVKPSLPVGAVELATIQVPAGATATNSGGVVITQASQFTASAGSTVPFRKVTEMNLWTTAQPNQLANVLGDTAAANGLYLFVSGVGWQSVVNDTGWIVIGAGGAPAFQSGWVNFGGAYQPARFRRLNGVVYVQGEVKSGTASGVNPIFTLPSGFRPAAYLIVPVTGNGGSTNIEIGSDGRILPGDVALTPLRQSITLTPFPADQ